MVAEQKHVASRHNARLKLVRKLHERRGREREGAFVVEGEDLVEAGLRAGWRCRFVLVDAGRPPAVDVEDAAPVVRVPSAMLAEASTLGHAARVLAVFDTNGPPPGDVAVPTVFLDGVSDPGNVGTVLRSAAAFGAAVALGPGCADRFGPKAVRASMGAVFTTRCSIVDAPPSPRVGGRVVALDAGSDTALWDVDLGAAPVICAGAERAGLSAGALGRADIVASIPITERAESLNVAMAVTASLYEWRRQLDRRPA